MIRLSRVNGGWLGAVALGWCLAPGLAYAAPAPEGGDLAPAEDAPAAHEAASDDAAAPDDGAAEAAAVDAGDAAGPADAAAPADEVEASEDGATDGPAPADEADEVSFPIEGFDWGSLSMRAVRWG